MARYKSINTSPRFLVVDLQRQLLPGTFEHALNHLIDHELDLSRFDARFKNDVTGATAYPPGMLLKVILFAYSQGLISSRAIEAACREHVTFIALSGDTQPHFTTIAAFVSHLGADIAAVFSQILYLCDRQGLILHSDRGSQYCSHVYRKQVEQCKLRASMSRRGNCYDNAPMESFWASLKNALVHHHRYETRLEAEASIREFIEIFYNCQRCHSRLGNVAPAVFAQKLSKQVVGI